MDSVSVDPPKTSSRPGRLCPLEQAIGRSVECPRERCPFWEPGGAVVPAGCLFDRLSIDFGRRRDAAELVLALKARLERPSSDEDERTAWAEVYELIRDGLDQEEPEG
ncbi:MAG: hypothetical protein ACRDNH_04380 [Gaiellaceae bacterium]